MYAYHDLKTKYPLTLPKNALHNIEISEQDANRINVRVPFTKLVDSEL